MPAQLDFFYFIGSTYSYLSVQRAEALAEREGVVLNWRPFSVRTLMREQNNSPFTGKPVKMAYMWRDIERRAEQLRLPFNGPPPYPIDADELANRVATLAAIEGWCAEFSQAAYRLWFLRKQDPGDADALSDLLSDLGHDAEAVLARANSDAVRARYAAETDTARSLGLFGSPSFVADGEVFWGDDRLEEALAWCKSHRPVNEAPADPVIVAPYDRFDHVFVQPGSFDASLAFYRDALGWPLQYVWGDDGQPRGASLGTGAVRIVLAEAHEETTGRSRVFSSPSGGLTQSGRSGGAHDAEDKSKSHGINGTRPTLHLQVDDLDRRHAHLHKRGAALFAPEPTHWGTRWFVAQDPDGNLIAFEQPLGSS